MVLQTPVTGNALPHSPLCGWDFSGHPSWDTVEQPRPPDLLRAVSSQSAVQNYFLQNFVSLAGKCGFLVVKESKTHIFLGVHLFPDIGAKFQGLGNPLGGR